MPSLGRGSLAAAAWAACLATRPLAARAESFDCDAEWSTWESDWSDLKKAWCCEHEQRGCPYDCTAGYSRWESGWSDQKKEWCCENKQLGCPASRSAARAYDCQKDYGERGSWSQEQKDWCCLNKQLGCFLPTTTYAPTPMTTQAPATEAPTATEGPSEVTLPPLATAVPVDLVPPATLPLVTVAPIATVAPVHASIAEPEAPGGGSANTTEAPCFEDRVSWEPLDMPGTEPQEAEDAAECQRRCAETEGCAHFSYWWVGKSCHLQDAYAARQTGRLGFISGPFGCWESLDQDKYIQKGLTIVQKSYKCAELSTLYMPIMGVSKQIQTEDLTAMEAAKECREYCASTEGCEHYSITFPERLCQMAGAGARKVTPYINAVSGSPTCWAGEEHDKDEAPDDGAAAAAPTAEPTVESDGGNELIMKTSLRHGAPASWRPPLASAAAMALFAGAFFAAWGVAAVVRRTRRRRDLLPRSSQPQTATGAYATVEGTTEPLAVAGAEE